MKQEYDERNEYHDAGVSYQVDLEEQIERCHRLARELTDEQMRSALEELAEDYEAKLRRGRRNGDGQGFMLQR